MTPPPTADRPGGSAGRVGPNAGETGRPGQSSGAPVTGSPVALPFTHSSQDFAHGVGPLPNRSFRDVPFTSTMSPRLVKS